MQELFVPKLSKAVHYMNKHINHINVIMSHKENTFKLLPCYSTTQQSTGQYGFNLQSTESIKTGQKDILDTSVGAKLTGNGNRSPSTRAINSGRQLGYWKLGFTTVINAAVRCHYIQPCRWSSSPLQCITTVWPVPNYTAW